jgi:hypothetical protein
MQIGVAPTVWVLLTLAASQSVSTATTCSDEEAVAYIEDVLSVDVLYISRSKGVRCRAKVSGTER